MRHTLGFFCLLCLVLASCSTEYKADDEGGGASQATRSLQDTNDEIASLYQEACQCDLGAQEPRCSFLEERLTLTSCELGIVDDNEDAARSYTECMRPHLESLDACLSVCRGQADNADEQGGACMETFWGNVGTCQETFDRIAEEFSRCPACDPATEEVCHCINRQGDACGDDELGCWCNDQALGLEDGPALCVELNLCVQGRGCSSADVRAFEDACDFLTSEAQGRLGDVVALYDHMCNAGPAPGFDDVPVSLTCGSGEDDENNAQPPLPVCGDGVCENEEDEDSCFRDCGSVSRGAYLFLLVEDRTPDPQGTFPGVDLDAVVLSKADGSLYYASAVEDFNLVAGELAINPDSILGPPDDGCEYDATKVLSLGGQGGYIIVSFTTMNFDGRVENGDSITVYELGRNSCPNSESPDELYAASLSVSVIDAQTGNVFVLDSRASGEVTLPVSGL